MSLTVNKIYGEYTNTGSASSRAYNSGFEPMFDFKTSANTDVLALTPIPKSAKVVPKIKESKYIRDEKVNGVTLHKLQHVTLSNFSPKMFNKIILLNKKAEQLGFYLLIADGPRSHKAQEIAYKKKPDLAAAPYSSAHEYGIAADISIYKNGKCVSIDKVPELYSYIREIGLEWGGDWEDPYEPWHVNLKDWQFEKEVYPEWKAHNPIKNLLLIIKHTKRGSFPWMKNR